MPPSKTKSLFICQTNINICQSNLVVWIIRVFQAHAVDFYTASCANHQAPHTHGHPCTQPGTCLDLFYSYITLPLGKLLYLRDQLSFSFEMTHKRFVCFMQKASFLRWWKQLGCWNSILECTLKLQVTMQRNSDTHLVCINSDINLHLSWLSQWLRQVYHSCISFLEKEGWSQLSTPREATDVPVLVDGVADLEAPLEVVSEDVLISMSSLHLVTKSKLQEEIPTNLAEKPFVQSWFSTMRMILPLMH